MKIDEVLEQFSIFTTNEEQEVLDRMEHIRPMEAYTEREKFVIENLIRKSLVSKVKQQNVYMVVKNEQQKSRKQP
jgi:hypothetical protein